MIECPYCISEVDDQAVACRSCGRDLSGHTYLLRRLSEHASMLVALQQQIESFGSGAPVAQRADAQSAPQSRPDLDTQALFRSAAIFILLPDVLLLTAHRFLVFSFNLNPAWLLAATLILPFPFGFFSLLSGSRGLVFWAFVFFVNSLFVVFAMTLATAYWGSDPNAVQSFLPATHQEWIQEAEFATSMFLSSLTGLFVSTLWLLIRYPEHVALSASRSGLVQISRRMQLAVSASFIEKVGKYLSSLGAIISAVGAVYFGIQRL